MSLWFFPIHSCGAIVEHLPMHEKLTKYGKLTAHNERKISIHMQMLFHETYIRFFTYLYCNTCSIPKNTCTTFLENKLSPRFLLFHHNCCLRLFMVYFQVKFVKMNELKEATVTIL